MKHTMNTMKRVLAATLSVLTVASPIGANVGVFLTEGATLVASAETYTTGSHAAVSLNADADYGDVLERNTTITNAGMTNSSFSNGRAYIYLNGTSTNNSLRYNNSSYASYTVSQNAVRVTSTTGSHQGYGGTYGRIDLITCTKLTSSNCTISFNGATSNTVDYDGTAKSFTVRYNSNNFASTNYDVTIKKNGVEVQEIKEVGNYTVTVTGKGSYYGVVTSETFTVRSVDERNHNFAYSDLFPNEVNQYAQFDIRNGATTWKVQDFTLTLNGTDNDGYADFTTEKGITISAPQGKVISSVEFIAANGKTFTSQGFKLDSLETEVPEFAAREVVTVNNTVIARNLIATSMTIFPTTNGDDHKIAQVRVYYVDPIQLTTNNISSITRYYSPDVPYYPLNMVYTGNRDLTFNTDYTVTVEDSEKQAVQLVAAENILGAKAQYVDAADNYAVTVTGKGVFKGTATVPWTVAKYELNFITTATGYNARVTEEQANRTYAVKAKEGVENPSAADDYEIATQKYDTSVQVRKRDTLTGTLNTSLDSWFTIDKGADKDFVISGTEAETADINAVTTGALSEAINANQGSTNYRATITGVNNFTNSTTRTWTIAKATIANTDYTAPVTSVTATNPLYYTGTEDTEKKDLAVAGTFAPNVQVPTNEDGTAIEGIVGPKFEYRWKRSDQNNNQYNAWSTTLPADLGRKGVDTTYDVQYRIVGGTNYNNVKADSTAIGTFQTQVLRKPTTIKLNGLDAYNPETQVTTEAVLVRTSTNGSPDNGTLMVKNADGVYDVKAADKFYLYTDMAVVPDNIVGKSATTNVEYGGTTYAYRYEITIPDVPADLVQGQAAVYNLTHSYATRVISAANGSNETDKIYVRDDNQAEATDILIATFDNKTGAFGNGVEYYYGNAPTEENDVIITPQYGATASIYDFYYYRADDANKTRLAAKDLEAGTEYFVKAEINVTLTDGNGNEDVVQAYIEKKIKYVARPLAECAVYLVDENGSETQLTVDKTTNSVTIDANTFTYNKSEQKPNIVVKSPAYNENSASVVVTLESTDLTDGIEAKKNAGQYTGTLTGIGNNYTGELTVNWSIAKAENRMTIEPKAGVVYDGELLDIDDFSVEDPDFILTEENPTILVTPNETNGSTLKKAGLDQSGTVTVSCANYKQGKFNVEGVNINKRSINATPDVNQSTVYGVMAGNIKYVLEDANGVRGLVPADQNDADLRDKAVLIGNYDYNDAKENDAGKYTYVGNETLANYNVEIVGANTNKFTVTQKDISDFIVILNPTTVDENGDWLAKQDTDEKLGDYYYYTYDGETNFEVEVALIISNDAPDYTYILDGDDYILGGATRRITANSDSEPFYFVQAEGKGNYTGIAKAPWQVRGQGVEGLSLTINGGEVANEAKTVTYNGYEIEYDYAYNGTDPNFKANITDFTCEFYEGTTKLPGAPKNAGEYTVEATVSATGYRDSKLKCTLTIAPATLNLEAADAAKTIQYGTDENLKYDAFGKAYFPLTVDDIDNIGGFVDADRALVMQAVEDGKFVFDWQKKPNTTRQYVSPISWNQKDGSNTVAYLGEDLFAVLNRNYNWDNVNYTLKVTPKPISRDDVEIIYDASSILGDNVDENGYTYNKVKVIDHTTGQTLVEGVDYVVNNNGTKEAGQFRIEVVGQENYCSYVRKDWKVTKDVTGIYTFKRQEPGVAINPQNKGIYVKLGFEGQIEYSNYRATEYGVIYNNDGTATLDELRLDNPERNEDPTKVSRINVLRNKNGINVRDKGKGVTATGYVILEDKNNPENVHVAYTDFNIGGDTYVCNEYAPEGVTNAGNNYVKVMYEGNIYKKGYSLVEYGLIYNNTGEATVEELTLDNVDNKKIVQIKDKNASNIRDTGKGVTAVGYMIVKNEANLQAVIYTNDLGGKFAQLANLH